MVTLPAVSNVVRCAYAGTYNGAKWVNIFHVQHNAGTVLQSDMDALAAGLQAAWNADISRNVATTVQLTSTTCVDLSSNTGLQSSNGLTASGSVTATAALPASVAIVISWTIARRYRGGHPRMYLTGQVGANLQNSMLWASAWPGTVNTNMTAWRLAVNSITTTNFTTIALCNVGYFTRGVLNNPPKVDLISGNKVHARVDSQRRRLGKEVP